MKCLRESASDTGKRVTTRLLTWLEICSSAYIPIMWAEGISMQTKDEVTDVPTRHNQLHRDGKAQGKELGVKLECA